GLKGPIGSPVEQRRPVHGRVVEARDGWIEGRLDARALADFPGDTLRRLGAGIFPLVANAHAPNLDAVVGAQRARPRACAKSARRLPERRRDDDEQGETNGVASPARHGSGAEPIKIVGKGSPRARSPSAPGHARGHGLGTLLLWRSPLDRCFPASLRPWRGLRFVLGTNASTTRRSALPAPPFAARSRPLGSRQGTGWPCGPTRSSIRCSDWWAASFPTSSPFPSIRSSGSGNSRTFSPTRGPTRSSRPTRSSDEHTS